MELQDFIKLTLKEAVDAGAKDTEVNFDIGIDPNRYYDNGKYIPYIEVNPSSLNRMKFSIIIK